MPQNMIIFHLISKLFLLN